MKRKLTIIITLIILFITGIIGISNMDTVKKIIHQTTSQPEEAPFQHM